jgi:hypothetical protein
MKPRLEIIIERLHVKMVRYLVNKGNLMVSILDRPSHRPNVEVDVILAHSANKRVNHHRLNFI